MKFSYLASFAMVAVVLSSCGGLNKMKETVGTLKPTVTPEVLEMKGGKVEVAISGNFPPKFFNKKAILEVTPVLKYTNGETAYPTVAFQGEKVQANNKVIKYKEGGDYSLSGTVDYNKDMMVSDLILKLTASVKDKKVDWGTIKIANGVKATASLVVKDPKALTMKDNFQRVTGDSYEADIHYLMNKADVRPTELKKEEVKKLREYIKNAASDSQKRQLSNIVISAYASPDGPQNLNANLANDRKVSADKFLKEFINEKAAKKGKKASKKETLNSKMDSLFSMMSTPEDWDGFKDLMEKSDIKDKDLVLRVLSMYSDPDVREREIRNISKAFEEIADKILPQLRRSKMIAKINVIGKSDEQLKQLSASNPDSLNLEELLYAASLTKDNDAKLSIYQAAEKKYPDDVRIKNNLGYTYLQLNKIADAKSSFEAAKAIKDDDIIRNNLGCVALLEGDNKAAENLFTSAAAAGSAVNYNLGIVKIISGDYPSAVNYFGNANEVNAGLAKLLNGQYDAAITTLGNAPECSLGYYLKAVAAARSGNSDVMFSNLRSAVAKDASYKAYAQKDVEFLKFFNDATFKSIVQ